MITLNDWKEYLAIIINNDASNRLSINNKYSVACYENIPIDIGNIPFEIYNKLNLTIDDIFQHQFILFTKLCYMSNILYTNGYIFYENMNIMNGIDILNFMNNTSILIKNISNILVEFDDKVKNILNDKNICTHIYSNVSNNVYDEINNIYDKFIKNIIHNIGNNSNNSNNSNNNGNNSIILNHFNELIKSILSRNIIIKIIEITLGEIIDPKSPIIDEIMQVIL